MSTEKQNDWKSREIAALWKKTSASGRVQYTGNLKIVENGVVVQRRIIAFENANKKTDAQPDMNIYVMLDEGGGAGSAGSGGSNGAAATGPAKPKQSASGPASGPAPTGPRRAAPAAAPKNDDIPYGME